ncbi:MAG: YigZ family protein [Flavobacteriales bacterium]|nr:MAG: YigZ family protein [Flavobacteriales bacterium]
MNNDLYQIITTIGEGDFREKGSKFLGFAVPMESIEYLDVFLSALRSSHPKARHFCYAYRLSANDWRANDDGEPRHSAGTPILRQIQSRELFHTAVVVVRYFGGTKLGVSGLIRAYETAAAIALDAAKTVSIYPSVVQKYRLNYPAYNRLMQLLPQYDAEVTHQELSEDVLVVIRVRESKALELALMMEKI